jgi:phenylalanyl-tRNA synthetase beta chain
MMRVSLSWLYDYLSEKVEARETARRLTDRGIEVEGIEEIGLGLSGVVAVKIVSARPHPEAQKLNLCTVDDGSGHTLEIVCGAQNWKVGDIVPFAREGATLPGGITIAAKALKGIVSRGMLCSEKELGLSEDAAGLWILPAGTAPGLDIASAVRDTVLVLGVTPNRPDCLSHVGVAREVAAAFGLHLRFPTPDVASPQGEASEVSVSVVDAEGCPRYAARAIRGVTVQASPLWMQRRLAAAGMRSISNLVDVTNYVMLELGQPLHAFDLAHLRGQKIIVRRAAPGEVMKTLDGQSRSLSQDGAVDLVIADGEAPVAIAGVMGGLTSEVSITTRDVLVESAYFHPTWVRKTSKRQQLHTESSHRFERGTDPEGVLLAQDRALSLMQQLGGGEISQGRTDAYPAPIARRRIELRASRVRQVLGVAAPVDGLSALGFVKLSGDESRATWEIPAFRPDVEREIDLVEEVARLYGVDSIPVQVPKMATTAEPPAELLSPVFPMLKLREAARLLGYSEAVNYGFCHSAEVAKVGWAADDPRSRPVRIKNPLNDSLDVMRPSLLVGLLQTVLLNQRRQYPVLRLFEVGRVFAASAPGAGEGPVWVGDSLPKETQRMAAVLVGDDPRWYSKEAPDLFDVKGLAESLCAALGHAKLDAVAQANPALHLIPGAAAALSLSGLAVGELGELHPDLLERFEITGRVFWLDLDLSALLRVSSAEHHYQRLSRFPAVSRDMAFFAPQGTGWAEIARCIDGARTEIVQSVRLFDVYQGKNAPESQRSLAITLSYQSHERTLTDEEVNAAHERIARALRDALGVTLR